MVSKHVQKNASAYCHGELSAEESKEFAEHIIGCSPCRAAYEEVKNGIHLAEQLPRSVAPADAWAKLEASLDTQRSTAQVIHFWRRPQFKVAIAAAIVVAITAGAWWLTRTPNGPPSLSSTWRVERINGTPKIESSSLHGEAQLAVGQWLETDASSRAQIAENSIGQVEIDPNTRLRLLGTSQTEHRFELARGKMSALIWAPPRLFFVDTPSAVAADLGCAYTLEVDDAGGSLLRVTAGWVALQLQDRESMVPAGAACQTRKGIGPGTPYFEDASSEFRQALSQFDFESGEAKHAALAQLLSQARNRDTLTLWHLLSRVSGEDRLNVYSKIASFVPPPEGVTQEGILNLDSKMLERWRDELQPTWSLGLFPKALVKPFWGIKNGVNSKANKQK
jgi:ferric-dicitrate binding protein FerR (iron transport regulator)